MGARRHDACCNADAHSQSCGEQKREGWLGMRACWLKVKVGKQCIGGCMHRVQQVCSATALNPVFISRGNPLHRQWPLLPS